ncbi:unnamed protein product [Adineta steineri]|uniref:NAD(P)(+)--arginine ADP-ribosyltransferase n=1 Tax=Adineta steineri TaxID=433720 RepID=A0A816EDX4_9BILA|nr:unnamed protein product [Adineta steineri]CAF1645462.1 unnamed protein product [Adineta steineri]
MSTQQSKGAFGSVSSSGASNTTVTITAPSTPQRIIQNYLLIWVDETIDQTKKDCQNTLKQFGAAVNDVIMFNQPYECIQFLDQTNDEQAFVITSGSLGKNLVPEIHGMPNLDAIYIFCGNVSYHQQWTKSWNKIKGIHNNIKDICDALKEGVKQVNQDATPISFVAANEAVSNENLNQLKPNYMYTQIFKDILLQMKHNQNQDSKTLAAYCRDLCSNNTNQLNVIDEFKHNYRPEQAIWWYTRECFIYQMLNRALRTLDADTIINMGFFIRDLHQQIKQLHKQQFSNYRGKPFEVYRGQVFLKTNFDKLKKTEGGLMSFDSFLSTSRDRDVALEFAKNVLENTDKLGVLFIMTIDPRVSSAPFASIDEISYFKAEEEEILFSMHTVFRIGAIKQMNNNDLLYQVELQLTADDDEQLRQLTECMSKDIVGATGWERLGNLLLKTGHCNKAEELYKTLLEQPSNECDKGHYYEQLGVVKYQQGNYDQAIKYYEKVIEIQERTLPVNHPSSATSYNNIGSVYKKMAEYSKALLFYEEALRIRQKNLSADHPDLATSYNSIGSMCDSMGEYSQALSFYKKALKIREEILPPNHPSLATPYSNIGMVYMHMREYTEALLFHEKALGIKERTLPGNHPSLTTSYNNIGTLYEKMGEYSKALSFHEKVVGIWEKTRPANHPDLAASYSNLGSLYYSMEEYSEALSYFERALDIFKVSLPPNHPNLKTVEVWIESVKEEL